MTSYTFEKFSRFLCLRPTPSKEKVKLISANFSPICSLDTMDIELPIQGLVLPFTMHVLKSLSHKMILGQDFSLQFSNAVISCGDCSITLLEGLVCAALTRCPVRDSVSGVQQQEV